MFANVSRSKVTLVHEGLQCLEEYDYIVVITVEGNFKSDNSEAKTENAIWISKYPQYNH